MRLRRARALLSLLLLPPLIGAGPVLARDTGAPRARAPEKNFSNLHADTEWIVKAFASAEEAIGRGTWGVAVRHLQEVADARTSRASEGTAAPYVQPVQGSRVYEGAWKVALHRIARGGHARPRRLRP